MEEEIKTDICEICSGTGYVEEIVNDYPGYFGGEFKISGGYERTLPCPKCGRFDGDDDEYNPE